MKKSRLTESQIFSILQAVEKGRLVKDVCREYSIAESPTMSFSKCSNGMK